METTKSFSLDPNSYGNVNHHEILETMIKYFYLTFGVE
jgi:hypothetical protein